MIDLNWTDNCDGTGMVNGTDTSDGNSCPEVITREWSYTDACNNTTSVTQIITIEDTIAPELTAPVTATYECLADVPAIDDLTWTDNCDGTGSVSGTESNDGASCPLTITREWTYTDACNNTTAVSQIITVNDTESPVLDAAPVAVTIECPADLPAMIDLNWTCLLYTSPSPRDS